jgi:dihydrolipoamide dehydrogenase
VSAGTSDTDVIVLGAGSGGYACALRAAQLGLDVTLIEADKIGGTCLHRGCIPTKAMLHAAEVADTVRHAPSLGVEAELGGIDIGQVGAFKTGIVGRLYKGLTGLIAQRGIHVISGTGVLTGPDTVEVAGLTVRAPNIVIATGSRPRPLPDLPIAGHVITSDQALGMNWIPRTAVVVGGGPIGVEFASLWRSFGAQVAIVEALDRLLPAEDGSSSKALERALRRRGIAVKTSVTVADISEDASGVHVTLSDGGTLDTDIVLVAIGRLPATGGLGLEAVGVKTDRGYVIVDEQCHTGVAGLWAVGDIVPGLQLAHRGFAQGIAVAERIAGLTPPPLVESGIPRIVYSDPEVASVGLTQAQAAQRYGPDGIETETQTLGGNARSLVLQTIGTVTVIRAKDGPVVGIHLVGGRVGELIGEAQLIVGWEAFPDDVAALIHAHPTQTEAIGEAHLALAGRPLHAHG